MTQQPLSKSLDSYTITTPARGEKNEHEKIAASKKAEIKEKLARWYKNPLESEPVSPLESALHSHDYQSLKQHLEKLPLVPTGSIEPLTLLHLATLPNTDDQHDPLTLLLSYPLGQSLLNTQLPETKSTPLIFACAQENVKGLVTLVGAGANVNIQDSDGDTALHLAAWANTPSAAAGLISKLLEKVGEAVDVNLPNAKGLTPVHAAIMRNNLEAVLLLLKAGADVNSRTVDSISPADSAHGKKMQSLIEDWKHYRKFKNQVLGLPEQPLKGSRRVELRTSDSYPLEIDFVDLTEHNISGKIGMCMCPGRNKKMWRRDISKDIERLQQVKAEVMVPLVRVAELTFMGIPHLVDRYRETNFEVLHRPIMDKWIPSSMDFLLNLVREVLDLLKEGKVLVVHCNGGKGRAGMVVTSTLIALGVSPQRAIQTVRNARPGTIRNPAQIAYVRLFRRYWFSSSSPPPLPITSPENSEHNKKEHQQHQQPQTKHSHALHIPGHHHHHHEENHDTPPSLSPSLSPGRPGSVHGPHLEPKPKEN